MSHVHENSTQSQRIEKARKFTVELSRDQQQAVARLVEWFNSKDRSQVIRLVGRAGTGKTTAAAIAARSLNVSPAFLAPTGRAAEVMRRHGMPNAQTIHQALYVPIQPDRKAIAELEDELENASSNAERSCALKALDRSNRPTFMRRKRNKLSSTHLIIVDEASMVPEKVARDLLACGVPIIAMGDPWQLPPVGGAGTLLDGCWPCAELERVHRQAEQSAILKLAELAYHKKSIKPKRYSNCVDVVGDGSFDVADILEFELVLCGKRSTRHELNRRIKEALGLGPGACPTGHERERIICRENNRQLGLLNGMSVRLKNVEKPKSDGTFKADLIRDDATSKRGVKILCSPFEDPNWDKQHREYGKTVKLEWAFALTAHLAQGGEWGSVAVIDESRCFRAASNRWLYTALTRARHKLRLYN